MSFTYGANSSTAAGGPSGAVVSIFNADAQPIFVQTGTDKTQFQYDPQGRTVVKTLPYGDSISYSYDGFNRVVTQTHGPESDSFGYGSLPGSASWNKWTSHTDSRGNAWIREYDTAGNLTKETDPEGGVKVWTYDGSGNLGGYSDPTTPNPIITAYTNQPSGEVTQAVIDPGNLALNSQFSNNANGDRVGATDPNGNTTSFTYNNSRWKTSMTAPSLLQTTYGYDMIGNLVGVSRQTGGSPNLQSTGTTYSLLNKPTVVTDPLGHQTQFAYDVLGRRVGTLDALNHFRSYVLDVNGRLQTILDANFLPEETRVLYPGGDVNSLTDANGNTSVFVRDSIGRLTQITYPDNTTEQWTLDANGNVTQFTTRDGKTIGQSFDKTNRVTTRSPVESADCDYRL